MNAVINRIMSMAERIAPNLRALGAKLGLAQAITAATPAHCNNSVSVIKTTAALPSRRKIIGSPSSAQLIVAESGLSMRSSAT
jgi:hypothetical protein